jgi:hypothetical protein
MNLPKTLSMHAYLPPAIAIPMPAGREQYLPQRVWYAKSRHSRADPVLDLIGNGNPESMKLPGKTGFPPARGMTMWKAERMEKVFSGSFQMRQYYEKRGGVRSLGGD